jgi:hypothetical protein
MKPAASSIDFKTLAENKFEVTLPSGIKPSVAARAIFASARGMAFDAAPVEKISDKPFSKLQHILASMNLPPEKMSEAERLLCELAESEPPPKAFDEETDLPPEWTKSERQRVLHWAATEDMLRKRGASDSDISEFQKQWVEMFGALPKNGLTGGMGGALAGDRKARARRQAAFDSRYPEFAKLDSSYPERPAARREPTASCYDRWPEAARITSMG